MPPLQLRLEALPGAADAREELADEAEDDAQGFSVPLVEPESEPKPSAAAAKSAAGDGPALLGVVSAVTPRRVTTPPRPPAGGAC